MQTLSDMAKALNRPTVYLSGLQTRFELPVFPGAGYSEAYLEFLRTVVYLRVGNVSEEALRELWAQEKKLLQLLHVYSTGSKTWFLDFCGVKEHPQRRLLLSNYDVGIDLSAKSLQLGLNFAVKGPELFAGAAMGEDALRVLKDYVKRFEEIKKVVKAEKATLREVLKWSKRCG